MAEHASLRKLRRRVVKELRVYLRERKRRRRRVDRLRAGVTARAMAGHASRRELRRRIASELGVYLRSRARRRDPANGHGTCSEYQNVAPRRRSDEPWLTETRTYFDEHPEADPNTKFFAVVGTAGAFIAADETDGLMVRLRAEDRGGGYTILFYAAYLNCCELIEEMVARGADPNVACLEDNATPLHMAAQWDNRSAATLLLDHGARVDGRSRYGRTPLHVAAAYGNCGMIRLLLRNGAALDAVDRARSTAKATAMATDHAAVEDPRSRFLAGDVSRLPYRGLSTYAFLAGVTAAGGWRAYLVAPRVRLLALRNALPALRANGYATASVHAAHERIFSVDALPKDVFWNVLKFWRSERDDDGPFKVYTASPHLTPDQTFRWLPLRAEAVAALQEDVPLAQRLASIYV